MGKDNQQTPTTGWQFSDKTCNASRKANLKLEV
jgi:hypothetical protein